jgi:polysaccharide pyruvyl transferase WcaK-like protein
MSAPPGPNLRFAATRRRLRRYSLVRAPSRVFRDIPFLLRTYRSLRDIDLVVVAGSGPLTDTWGGPFGTTYTVFEWSQLARASGTRFAFVSVGAGPLRGTLSRRLVRSALRSACYLSARDAHSVGVLRDAGVRRPIPIYPDMAFGLDVDRIVERTADVRSRDGREERGTIGFNPMAHRDPRYWIAGDESEYQRYIAKATDFALALLKQGFRVKLFSTELVGDPRTIRDINARLRDRGAPMERVTYEPTGDVQGLLAQMADCDFIVASRYHGVVLSLLLRKPTIGLVYDPKTRDVMQRLGQGSYAVDIDDFEPEDLVEAFTSLRSNGIAITMRLGEQLPALRREVEAQFDLVFSQAAAA